MLVIFTVISTYNDSLAAEPSISLPSSSEAYLKDFTVKRTIAVNYNAYPYIDKSEITKNQIVGYCHVFLGSYRSKEKIDGKNYDAIMVKCAMEPQQIKSKSGQKLYGHSQYLRLQAPLGTHCTYQYNTPNNATIGTDSYTIAINANNKGAGITGSVSIDSAYCVVTDNSHPSINKFQVSYDYKTTWLSLLCTTARRNALHGTTWPLAACEWTTNYDKYNIVLDVYARFGLSYNQNAVSCGDRYISGSTGLFIASFTKGMK